LRLMTWIKDRVLMWPERHSDNVVSFDNRAYCLMRFCLFQVSMTSATLWHGD
jgi:hypothetical protein